MRYKDFKYKIEDGAATILSYTGNKKKVEIPNIIDSYVVKKISSLSFIGLDELEKLIIPNTIEEIEESAFIGCINLKEVHIKLVTIFSRNAFIDCNEKAVFFTDSLDMAEDIAKMSKSLYIVCDKSFDIEVIDNMNMKCKIKNIPFYSESLYIPDEVNGYKVTEIDFTLQKEFRKGKRIRLPKYLKKIPKDFFRHVILEELEFFDNIEEIEKGAFAFSQINSGSYNFELPKALKIIGDFAFDDCSWLRDITIPDEVEYIGEGAFMHGELTSITMSSSVKHIGRAAFAWDESLVSVKLSENIESIEKEVFWQCHNLNTIAIPKGLKRIEKNAFHGCYSLKNIEIPNSVEEIGNDAFANCRAIEEITIPNIAASIGRGTFLGCTNLNTINYDGKADDALWGAFNANLVQNNEE